MQDSIADRRAAPLPLAPGVVAVATRVAALTLLCVAGLVVYRRVAPRTNDDFWAFLLALAIPGAVLAGCWLLREAVALLTDRAAIRRAIAATGKLRRGQWTAATGRAVALAGERAGEDGPQALATSYVVHLVRSESSRVSVRGRSTRHTLRRERYHLEPTGVATPAGVVRLGGFPDLAHLDEGDSLGELALPQWEEATPGPPAFRFFARARLFAAPRESVDADWRYGREEAAGRVRHRKRVLVSGTEVCVLGAWREGSLLPRPWRPRGLPVYPGAPAAAVARIGAEATVYLGMALLVLAGAAGLGWAFAL